MVMQLTWTEFVLLRFNKFTDFYCCYCLLSMMCNVLLYLYRTSVELSVIWIKLKTSIIKVNKYNHKSHYFTFLVLLIGTVKDRNPRVTDSVLYRLKRTQIQWLVTFYFVQYLEPVSYTHLDVYKRQV